MGDINIFMRESLKQHKADLRDEMQKSIQEHKDDLCAEMQKSIQEHKDDLRAEIKLLRNDLLQAVATALHGNNAGEESDSLPDQLPYIEPHLSDLDWYSSPTPSPHSSPIDDYQSGVDNWSMNDQSHPFQSDPIQPPSPHSSLIDDYQSDVDNSSMNDQSDPIQPPSPHSSPIDDLSVRCR